MDRYIGISVGVLAVAVAQWWFGRYCYRYFDKYFNMPRWLTIGLSLGGTLTYLFYVMGDEFIHTSMLGENTRTWKNDPDKGIHILPWGEVRKLAKEGRLQIVDIDEDELVGWGNWDGNQYHRLTSMIENLYYSRKRLARRLVKLEQELWQAPPDLRKRLVRMGAIMLRGKINADLIRQQTCQHPHSAEKGVEAFFSIFGGSLGPLENEDENRVDF